MSLITLVFPAVCWSELSHIVSFLSLRDLWVLGCTNRSAFITFMRERESRKFPKYGHIENARFLWKGSSHSKIALVSYPRSGNSFLRKLIEFDTGIVTGSDSRPNRTLSAALLRYGYRGEGITDDSVWVVKSHYPERLGYVRFPVSRVILLVRNPFDAMESYFHMGFTNTHDKVLAKQAFESLAPVWEQFVRNEALVWNSFHDYWMQRRNNVPLLVVRYEDVLSDRHSVLKRIREFMHAEGCTAKTTAAATTVKTTIATTVSTAAPVGSCRFRPAMCGLGKRKKNLLDALPLSSMRAVAVEGTKALDAATAATFTAPVEAVEVVDGNRDSKTGDACDLGYTPKKKKVGKGLDVMNEAAAEYVAQQCSTYMGIFGYEMRRAISEHSGSSSLLPAAQAATDMMISCDQQLIQQQQQLQLPQPLQHHHYFTLDVTDLDRLPTFNALSNSQLGIENSSSSNIKCTFPAQGCEEAAFSAVSQQLPQQLSHQQQCVLINDHIGLRNADDQFGRRFTELRRSLTDKDTAPFETM